MSAAAKLKNAKQVQAHFKALGETTITPEVKKSVASFARKQMKPSVKSLVGGVVGREGTSIIEKQGAKIDAKLRKGADKKLATSVSYVVGILGSANAGWIIPIFRWVAFGTKPRYTRGTGAYRGELRPQISPDAFFALAQKHASGFVNTIRGALRESAKKANR